MGTFVYRAVLTLWRLDERRVADAGLVRKKKVVLAIIFVFIKGTKPTDFKSISFLRIGPHPTGSSLSNVSEVEYVFPVLA